MLKNIKHFSLIGGLMLCTLLQLQVHAVHQPTETLLKNYELSVSTASDINQHVPLLRDLAKESSSVVEIGLRSMVSSWGLLLGLSESPFQFKSYLGVDIASPPSEKLELIENIAEENQIDFNFLIANSMYAEIPETDLLFIDSLHTYAHLTCELERYCDKVNKYIAMHDTSEPWGESDDLTYRGDYSEYDISIDRTKRGLWPAVEDFLSRHPEWKLEARHLNNHGFTILKRVPVGKIRILTFHYNNPGFLELQHLAFQKFLKNDYELIVLNDARTKEAEIGIQNVCDKYGIQCVRYEPKWHIDNPLNAYILSIIKDEKNYSHLSFVKSLAYIQDQASVRHCHAIQYALNHFGYDHDDIVVIMDGDFFLVRPLDLRSLMGTKDIIGAYRYFAEEDMGYMWVPFVALNMPKLPDRSDLKFHIDVIDNKVHDTGAHSHHYLKNHPDLKVKKYSWHGSTSHRDQSVELMHDYGFNDAEIALTKELPWPLCVEFHIDHHFLHFGASSFKLEGHDTKVEYVTNFLNGILKE